MKKILRVLFLFLLLCVCFTHVALADTDTVTPTVTVIDDLLRLAGYTLSLLFIAFVTWLANTIRLKYHLDIPQAWLDKVHTYVDQGVSYAEEQALNAAKNNVTITGNEKLNLALKFVLGFIGDDKKLLAMSEEKIKQLIEARLNQTRASTTFLNTDNVDSTVKADASTAVVHSVINTGSEQVVLMNDGTVKPLTPTQTAIANKVTL